MRRVLVRIIRCQTTGTQVAKPINTALCDVIAAGRKEVAINKAGKTYKHIVYVIQYSTVFVILRRRGGE